MPASRLDLCHIPTVLLDPREVMGMATTPWFHFEPPVVRPCPAPAGLSCAQLHEVAPAPRRSRPHGAPPAPAKSRPRPH